MNQYGDTTNFAVQPDDARSFNEIFDGAEYNPVEIKSFKLESLINEIEQLLLSPLELEQVSLPA